MALENRPPPMDDVLSEAAKLTHEERRALILQCVAEGRHQPDRLPVCITESQQEVPYCDRCWSVIDHYGLTWSWSKA